jgi:predicted transcriptional regulator
MAVTLTFRVDDQQAQDLTDLARAAGTTRSEVLRQLVADAVAGPVTDVAVRATLDDLSASIAKLMALADSAP